MDNSKMKLMYKAYDKAGPRIKKFLKKSNVEFITVYSDVEEVTLIIPGEIFPLVGEKVIKSRFKYKLKILFKSLDNTRKNNIESFNNLIEVLSGENKWKISKSDGENIIDVCFDSKDNQRGVHLQFLHNEGKLILGLTDNRMGAPMLESGTTYTNQRISTKVTEIEEEINSWINDGKSLFAKNKL